MIDDSVRMVPGVIGTDVSVTWSMDDSRLKPVTSDPVFPFGPK
jgi:hypothetical protein